jgi:hypothetical protein
MLEDPVPTHTCISRFCTHRGWGATNRATAWWCGSLPLGRGGARGSAADGTMNMGYIRLCGWSGTVDWIDIAVVGDAGRREHERVRMGRVRNIQSWHQWGFFGCGLPRKSVAWPTRLYRWYDKYRRCSIACHAIIFRSGRVIGAHRIGAHRISGVPLPSKKTTRYILELSKPLIF